MFLNRCESITHTKAEMQLRCIGLLKKNCRCYMYEVNVKISAQCALWETGGVMLQRLFLFCFCAI